MKLGRFASGKKVILGSVIGDRVFETSATTMMEAILDGIKVKDKSHRLAELRVLAPVERPTKIICVGLNYRSHIREMGVKMPVDPLIFTKPSSAIIGPGDDILLPAASSRVDYEGESALIMGKRARNVSDGSHFIFGYTCLNDVTARDLQKIDPDWTRAKGFDTLAPVGPFISKRCPTKVTTRLNGIVVQNQLLSDRVFGDAELVKYISTVMTLEPGDIIATGTPSGISPMKHGDVIEVELDGVGCLRNQVVKRQ